MSRVAMALGRRRSDQGGAEGEGEIPVVGVSSPENVEATNPWNLENEAPVERIEAAPEAAERRAGAGRPPRSRRGEPGRRGISLGRFNAEHLEKLVIAPDAQPVFVEEYRKLAATLHHAQAERQIKVVLIASALPGDGKTLASVNLSLTLSESYARRVLLIDADLRRSALHTVLRLPNVPGLTEALSAPSEQRLPINQVSPMLSVLCGGAVVHDPMSLLTSERMRQITRDAARTFDWIIIDTPPVAMMPDARLLSAIADGAVLVIRAGRTPFGAIERAVDALGRDRILGVLLNQVVERPDDSSSYYYYSYGAPGSDSR
jgi:capsular exopolysaccharide synthesis family protein